MAPLNGLKLIPSSVPPFFPPHPPLFPPSLPPQTQRALLWQDSGRSVGTGCQEGGCVRKEHWGVRSIGMGDWQPPLVSHKGDWDGFVFFFFSLGKSWDVIVPQLWESGRATVRT